MQWTRTDTLALASKMYNVAVNEGQARDSLDLCPGVRLERHADRPRADRRPTLDVDDLVSGRHPVVRVVGHVRRR